MALSVGLNTDGSYGSPNGFSCCGVRPIGGFSYIDEKALQADWKELRQRFAYKAFIGITASYQKIAEKWLRNIGARPISKIANARTENGGPIYNLTVWEIPGRGGYAELPPREKEQFTAAMIQQNDIERAFT